MADSYSLPPNVPSPSWRECEPGCLITTDRVRGGMGSGGHTGPCIKCCNACGPHCQMTGRPRRVCEPTCHYVHAQGMPLHKGPCVTCGDPLGCLANLRDVGYQLHDPEARTPYDCSQCTVEARLCAHKRTCCDSELNQWHAELCPHYGAERGWPQWSSVAAMEPPPMAMNEFTLLGARRNGKSIHYLMEQQRLLHYYAPEQIKIYDNATEFNAQPWTVDVDATFENEFTMNGERL